MQTVNPLNKYIDTLHVSIIVTDNYKRHINFSKMSYYTYIRGKYKVPTFKYKPRQPSDLFIHF